MGTYYAVQVVAGELDEPAQEELRAAIEAELEGVNARMSTWLPDSELSRFNRHADVTPFELSAPTLEVLETAREVSARTGGAFDVTVGPLVDAWGFGPGDREPPAMAPEEVRRLLDRIGWQKLEVDPAAGTVAKARPDLAVDLSAIAKGYAVDRVSERLAALGHGDHWVEVGGEVRAGGSSARGEPWRLGIERPRLAPGAVQRIVPISDLAVATSGDYRNYREVGGVRFSHIIDPRTGWPIRHRLASVSVFHPRCAVADALATAMMVLGEEEGEELARAEGLAVFFLVREGEEFVERGTPEFWRLAGEPAESPVE
jgi:thiamine biosynthesis lipoprotein